MPRRTIAIADYRIAFHRTAAISHHGIAFVVQMPRRMEIQMPGADYARVADVSGVCSLLHAQAVGFANTA